MVTVGKGGAGPVFCFPIWVYQSLPNFLPVLLNPLVFLVWSTNTYQPPDLGRNPGQNTITNHYRRMEGDGGPGDDLGLDQTDRMGHTVKGVVFAGLADSGCKLTSHWFRVV